MTLVTLKVRKTWASQFDKRGPHPQTSTESLILSQTFKALKMADHSSPTFKRPSQTFRTLKYLAVHGTERLFLLYQPAPGFHNYTNPPVFQVFNLYHPATKFHKCTNSTEAWLFLLYHPATDSTTALTPYRPGSFYVPSCNWIPQLF